jgi:hypothetical protein
MAAPLPGALEGCDMTPGNEAAEGGQMKSGVSASPRGRPLAVGHEPDDRYANGWHLEDRVIVHQNSTIVFS